MKYLAICLLVLGAGLVGCGGIKSETGYVCGSCYKERSMGSDTCPHCGNTAGAITVETAKEWKARD